IEPAGQEGVLVRGRARTDAMVDFGTVFLDPVGRIEGIVDLAGVPDSSAVYAQLFGIDRVARVDAATGSFSFAGLAVGNYAIRVSTPHPSFMPGFVGNIAVMSWASTAVDTVVLTPVSNWCCSKRVFLNTTTTGADVGVTIKKFPVLVRLTNENFDFISARTNGGDIRFLTADNTPMPYHLERWDPVNGRAEIWVKVDSVLGNNNTQHFIMLWGNPDASSEANSAAVFDTGMGFAGVWHMNEADSAAIADATGNRYDGRKYDLAGVLAAPGICGVAQRFDGAAGYIVLSNTASGKLSFAENGTYSVSAWVYAEVLDRDYHSIVSKGNQQWGLQLDKENQWQFYEFRHRVGWESTEAPAAAKAWKYVTAVRSGTKQYLYVDGVLADSTISLKGEVINRNTGDNVFIGRRTADTTRFWNGMIDEVRICSWAHSANWVKLCYMNQKTEDELVEFRQGW
ncbi:MAG: DUF2341 domain-containing protein, partial [Chitinispirillaceae bacterium]|nr:DUF2341 domain-containing protein [Chitinispirillaceae bacterium]